MRKLVRLRRLLQDAEDEGIDVDRLVVNPKEIGTLEDEDEEDEEE